MKALRFAVSALAMLVASVSIASGQWYLGANFNFGESSDRADNLTTGQAGLQIGKFLSDDLSVEVGCSGILNRNDFDIATLAGACLDGGWC